MSRHQQHFCFSCIWEEGGCQLLVRMSPIGVDSRRHIPGSFLCPLQLLCHTWCSVPRSGTGRRTAKVDDPALSKTILKDLPHSVNVWKTLPVTRLELWVPCLWVPKWQQNPMPKEQLFLCTEPQHPAFRELSAAPTFVHWLLSWWP